MLLNITFIVENEIKDIFLGKLSSEYIPNMQINSVLIYPKLHKIITTDISDTDSTSYALQFFAKDPEELSGFLSNHGNIITREFLSIFQNKVLAIISVMLEENIW